MAHLRSFGRNLLEAHGLSAAHAEIVEDNLLEADARGVRSHGHFVLPVYLQRLRAGQINPRPVVRIVRETPATLHVDGDRGPGAVAGRFTMQAVIAKAEHAGTAVGLARNSTHFGAAAHFAVMALAHDMIGYAATNAGPSMFPFGGRTHVVGNNPLAYAIPAGRERPLVLDMAMSTVANGRVAIARRLGEMVPLGWILDKHGQSSANPADLFDGGAGAPVGGPKGIGLAQVIDALAGVLAGAAFGPAVARGKPGEPLGAIGHVFQAIAIEAFMPVAEFKQRMDEQIRGFHAAERVDAAQRITVAGELEWERLDDARANGVLLLADVVADLNAAAAAAGSPDRL